MRTALSDRERAIQMAQELYREMKTQGVDMSIGPCLSEEVLPDWCADVAHSPRQAIDDMPQNQCQSYLSGRVHHFVELDPDGNLIRAG